MTERKDYKNSGLIKSPPVVRISSEFANDMLDRWHYLGKVPGIICAFGNPFGCCVFITCRSRMYQTNQRKAGKNVIELGRMVGEPGHSYAMSSLMSACINELKKLNEYDFVVTYSDPMAGHDGHTYLAAGWVFDGYSSKEDVYKIDGKRISRRALYSRHGTQSVPVMKEIYGNRLVILEGMEKKRFIKILRDSFKKDANQPVGNVGSNPASRFVGP